MHNNLGPVDVGHHLASSVHGEGIAVLGLLKHAAEVAIATNVEDCEEFFGRVILVQHRNGVGFVGGEAQHISMLEFIVNQKSEDVLHLANVSHALALLKSKGGAVFKSVDFAHLGHVVAELHIDLEVLFVLGKVHSEDAVLLYDAHLGHFV